MRAQEAPPSTPLARVIALAGRCENISPKIILKTLKTAVGLCGPNLRFESKDLFACSLHAAGAMSLLFLSVESNVIKLIGRWHSNDILRHIQVQVEPLMRNLSRLMFTNGIYSFLPYQEEIPCF